MRVRVQKGVMHLLKSFYLTDWTYQDLGEFIPMDSMMSLWV